MSWGKPWGGRSNPWQPCRWVYQLSATVQPSAIQNILLLYGKIDCVTHQTGLLGLPGTGTAPSFLNKMKNSFISRWPLQKRTRSAENQTAAILISWLFKLDFKLSWLLLIVKHEHFLMLYRPNELSINREKSPAPPSYSQYIEQTTPLPTSGDGFAIPLKKTIDRNEEASSLIVNMGCAVYTVPPRHSECRAWQVHHHASHGGEGRKDVQKAVFLLHTLRLCLVVLLLWPVGCHFYVHVCASVRLKAFSCEFQFFEV